MKKAIILFLFISFHSFAQTDNIEINEFMENFRLQLIEPNKAVLDNILHPSFVYGHSNGTIESRAETIAYLTTGYYTFKDVEFKNIKLYGEKNFATVHYDFKAKLFDQAKNKVDLNLHVVMVLVKEKKAWQMVTRQGYYIQTTK
ncbi:MAG: nuclear transport factor 2 family protein [Leadbetterella sp.]